VAGSPESRVIAVIARDRKDQGLPADPTGRSAGATKIQGFIIGKRRCDKNEALLRHRQECRCHKNQVFITGNSAGATKIQPFTIGAKSMTKEEVMTAILKCATNLGRVPTREELMTYGEISRRDLRKSFGTLKRALSECKLERTSSNKKVEMENLFHDWARVARRLKKLPTMKEYAELSHYSVRPLKTRFVSWNFVPGGLKRFAEGWRRNGKMCWRSSMMRANHSRPAR